MSWKACLVAALCALPLTTLAASLAPEPAHARCVFTPQGFKGRCG